MKKFGSKFAWVVGGGVLLAAVALTLPAFAQAARNTLKGFKMPLSYYEGKGQSVAKSVLMGAEAQPLPDGVYLIKDVKLETYRENGDREFVVQAAQCTFDQKQRHVSSPGPLQIQTADGRFSIKGEGFEWRQAEGRLVISNQVETVIQLEPRKPTTAKP